MLTNKNGHVMKYRDLIQDGVYKIEFIKHEINLSSE